ncbi:MAG: hypothetical protein HQK51_04185 [Oligoflexia bacterium]|nr:hypothetical protein [Oligoflexia bacterium]
MFKIIFMKLLMLFTFTLFFLTTNTNIIFASDEGATIRKELYSNPAFKVSETNKAILLAEIRKSFAGVDGPLYELLSFNLVEKIEALNNFSEDQTLLKDKIKLYLPERINDTSEIETSPLFTALKKIRTSYLFDPTGTQLSSKATISPGETDALIDLLETGGRAFTTYIDQLQKIRRDNPTSNIIIPSKGFADLDPRLNKVITSAEPHSIFPPPKTIKTVTINGKRIDIDKGLNTILEKFLNLENDNTWASFISDEEVNNLTAFLTKAYQPTIPADVASFINDIQDPFFQIDRSKILSLTGMDKDIFKKPVVTLRSPPPPSPTKIDFSIVKTNLASFLSSISTTSDHLLDNIAATDVSDGSITYKNKYLGLRPAADTTNTAHFTTNECNDTLTTSDLKNLCTQMMTKLNEYANYLQTLLATDKATNIPTDTMIALNKITSLIPATYCAGLSTSTSATDGKPTRLDLVTKWLTFSHNMRLIGQIIKDAGNVSVYPKENEMNNLMLCLSRRLQHETTAFDPSKLTRAVTPPISEVEDPPTDTSLDAPLATLTQYVGAVDTQRLLSPLLNLTASPSDKLDPGISLLLQDHTVSTLINKNTIGKIEDAIKKFEKAKQAAAAGSRTLDSSVVAQFEALKAKYQSYSEKSKFLQQYAEVLDKYNYIKKISLSTRSGDEPTLDSLEMLISTPPKTIEGINALINNGVAIFNYLANKSSSCKSDAEGLSNTTPSELIAKKPGGAGVAEEIFTTDSLKKSLIEECNNLHDQLKKRFALLRSKLMEHVDAGRKGEAILDPSLDDKDRKKIQNKYLLSIVNNLFLNKSIVGELNPTDPLADADPTIGRAYSENLRPAEIYDCTTFNYSTHRISLISEQMAKIIEKLKTIKSNKLKTVANVSCEMKATTLTLPNVNECKNIELKPGMVLGRSGGNKFQSCLTGLYQLLSSPSSNPQGQELANKMLYISRKNSILSTDETGQLIIQDISLNHTMNINNTKIKSTIIEKDTEDGNKESYKQYTIPPVTSDTDAYTFDMSVIDPILKLECKVKP